MEVVPGKKLGIYEIGQNLYEVIKTLNCDFKYEHRGSVSALITKSNYFIFNDKKELITVGTKSSTKAKYNGIGYNTKISEIFNIFPNVNIGVEGDLTIPDHPGIYFMFSGSDAAALYESGSHNEGVGDFIGDIKVKQIVVKQI